LLDPLKAPVAAVQDFFYLTGRAFKNIFRRPHYTDDIIMQMDMIGVGSLTIVAMTGFFSGAVMALQMSRALAQYGQVGKTGTLVSLTLVRELGPVLTAIMVAGRNASGIASELGSMKVTEQIDALRMSGVLPIDYLIVPRFVASLVMTLTLATLGGAVMYAAGGLTAQYSFGVNPHLFFDLSLLRPHHIAMMAIKALAFGAAIPVVAGFCGLRARGSSEGVGWATTAAVIGSSFAVIVLDFIISAFALYLYGGDL
jgi:phospholipid/cholesterol/gamma-HCH transport system permease protein